MKSCFSQTLVWLVMGAIVTIFTLVFFNHYIIAVFPVIAGALVYFLTKTQRTLLRKKTTPIYESTEGLVKIQGTVSTANTLETPYFKQQCVAFVYEQANIDYNDESGSEYTVSAKVTEEFRHFHLANSTGKINVIINKLNLSNLPSKTEVEHSIKRLVNDIRHTERTIKNGDLINVLGYAVKNNNHEFELKELGDKPLVISTPDFEDKLSKSFRVIKYLFPYILLMYISVNYFLFFAPIKINLKTNTPLAIFSFFGMPILAVIFGLIGNKMTVFGKLVFSNLAGICFTVSLLTIPLLCVLFSTNTPFYRIVCIWLSVLFFSSLAFIANFKKLDGLFDKDNSI